MSKSKYDKIEYVIDEIENVDVEDELHESELVKVITTSDANVRPHPNYKAVKLKTLVKGTELDVIDIVEGVAVQGSDIWYQIEDGYVHFSQVREI